MATRTETDSLGAPDGDHDLKPRKASGLTHDQNLTAALDAAAAFLGKL